MGFVDLFTPKGTVKKVQDALEALILEAETLAAAAEGKSAALDALVR